MTPEMPGEARPEGGADAGDLVLGLEGGHAEPLVLAQLVQHVGGRGDRVGAQEQRQPGLPGAGDQPVRQGQVAGDLPVAPGRHRRRGHLVGDREDLGGLAERVPGLERGDVGVPDVRLGRELGRQEADRALGRPVVEPGQQPEREHVLGPGRVLAGQPELLHRLDGHPGQVERVHLVVGRASRRQRVGVVSDLGQVALGEVGGVGDDHATARQVGEVGLEGRRVHRDQHVRPIAGGHDVVVGEVQLEARHARQRAGGRADLGREVRQGGDVVAEHCRVGGEPVPGELHPVARVPGEADDHSVEGVDLFHCWTASFGVPPGVVGVGVVLPRSVVRGWLGYSCCGSAADGRR